MIILAVSASGCGVAQEAQTAFDTMMQTFQAGELEGVGRYYDFDTKNQFVNGKARQELLEKVLETLKEMRYRITGIEKIDGANVKFTVELTTLDFSEIMDQYIKRITAMTADAAYQAKVSVMTQEEYQGLLAEQMTEILEEELETVTKDVSVTMVKQGDTWIPGGDKEMFFGAVFGNLLDAVNSLV